MRNRGRYRIGRVVKTPNCCQKVSDAISGRWAAVEDEKGRSG
jgi:hypothetical protein